VLHVMPDGAVGAFALGDILLAGGALTARCSILDRTGGIDPLDTLAALMPL
jgi:hypothetical protein